jgi:hypothetical protein
MTNGVLDDWGCRAAVQGSVSDDVNSRRGRENTGRARPQAVRRVVRRIQAGSPQVNNAERRAVGGVHLCPE